jgi:DNA polymerase-3 subunit epsilon
MIAFDTETTSVDPLTARIVSAAVVTVQAGWSGSSRTWLINPGVPIDPKATEVHGITDAYAAEHGNEPANTLPFITDSLLYPYPIVAYNAAFDLTVLDRECARYENVVPFVPQYVIDPFILDKVVDRYRKGSRTLAATAEHYGVSTDGMHTAEGDALAAVRIAWKIGRHYPAVGSLSLPELHTLQAEARKEWAIDFRRYLVGAGRAEEAAGVSSGWPVIR